MRDAVLVQVGTGDGWEGVLRLLEPHHAAYCERHGFDWWPVTERAVEDRHPLWEKPAAICRALEAGYGLVVLLDADCLIVRPEVDLRTALRWGDLGMCAHQLPWMDFHLNSGAVWVRNTERAREFYDQVWAFPHLTDWDACSRPLGAREGEQHSMNRVLERRDYDLLEILPARWHSAEHINPTREPVIRAWHGVGGICDRKRLIGETLESL